VRPFRRRANKFLEKRMTDTSHAGAAGPTHRAVETGVALALIAFGVIVVIGSMKVGVGWGPEGPRSGFFPFYLGLSIIGASAINLMTALALEPRKLFADWSQLLQVLSVVIPTAIYVVALPWTGIYAASLVLITGFMMWLGRYSATMSAAVSIGTIVAIYLMFEKWFLVPLPKGPIEDFFGL
jgi:putative tricarboxylic transport membrane protein